ncbi:tripartite tricarboxylate transporter permease, partial [Klebsiella michiganensis]|uniref:tripartite tricarboxylate transporter permease n=1 Tax=Klebsiella michiganensis TaxID=1134687 RepID=UPI0025A01D85
PLIGLWVRLLTVPYQWLFPAVLMFVCIGTYSVNNSGFDVLVVAFFGALGYVLRLLAFPVAPMLLGFVLGPLMEEHFRRAMLLGRGDPMTFLERPISATVLALTALLLLWGLKPLLFGARTKRRNPT